MKINVSDLRSLVNQVLSHIENEGHDSVEVTVDYYWDIPKNLRYDAYQKPEDLTIGQLTDDWMELQKIVRGENDPIGYSLVWLSSILRAIGEETVK
jgi:hypothetical protein